MGSKTHGSVILVMRPSRIVHLACAHCDLWDGCGCSQYVYKFFECLIDGAYKKTSLYMDSNSHFMHIV